MHFYLNDWCMTDLRRKGKVQSTLKAEFSSLLATEKSRGLYSLPLGPWRLVGHPGKTLSPAKQNIEH